MNIKNSLVSIIIPFYNVENYLSECLNSVIRQTYSIENIEVILVDDCGKDSSLSIASSYMPFLGSKSKLISHKKNKGLGGARNTGIEESSGEYLMFLDSDDYLDSDTVYELMKALNKDNSDVVIYNMKSFSELDKKYPQNPSFDLFNIFNGNSKKIERYEFPKYPELAHSFSACNKIFKKEIFDFNKRFPENQHHEDALLIMTILSETKSISLVKNIFYRYRQRESINDKSITDTLFETREHFFEHIEIVEGLKKIAIKYPEMEYMLLWVSLRIMGTPIKSLLSTKNSLNLIEEEEFYKRVKNIFKNRNVAETYGIGVKISEWVIFNILLLSESDNLSQAKILYADEEKSNNNREITAYKKKFNKLKNNPKLYFKDFIKNQNKKIKRIIK